MTNCDAYVICTSPRSGSTLLCNLLTNTGVAGKPESYFHRPSLSAWLSRFDLKDDTSRTERDALSVVFQAAIVEGRLDTGIFGLRLQRPSFDYLSQKLNILHPGLSNDAERFRKAFGRTAFIHLTRQDKVEQAVSQVRAEQTGLWHVAPDGKEIERVSPSQTPLYDPDRIKACFDKMTEYDRQWDRWFATENINPLRISYESLSAYPSNTLSEILCYFELEYEAVNTVKAGVAKMADKINQDWAMRFRSEKMNY
jgi:LPS sulfotransferase NodH